MESRDKCCCFTGHRPEKLNIDEKTAKALLCKGIQHALDRGFTCFITGMAKGVDTWAAEMVLEFKNLDPRIILICALPYPDFCKGGTAQERRLRERILLSCDETVNICEEYNPFCFQTRNRWMVDNSSLVIALFTGEFGGTRNTLRYAEEKRVEIINLLK